jgi:hypothetical protein
MGMGKLSSIVVSDGTRRDFERYDTQPSPLTTHHLPTLYGVWRWPKHLSMEIPLLVAWRSVRQDRNADGVITDDRGSIPGSI